MENQTSFLTAHTLFSAPGKVKEHATREEGGASDKKGMWKAFLVVQGESSRAAVLKIIQILLWVLKILSDLHEIKTIFMILLRHYLPFSLSLFQEVQGFLEAMQHIISQ